MAGFYNEPEQAVPSMLFASCLDSTRVIPHPAQPSVLVGEHLLSSRTGRTTALLTGGGSGHEPFAAGFIGDGLVDGCVAGQVFTSPTAGAVAELISTVAETCKGRLEGICIVVLNYQGDRLNFSRAVHDVQCGSSTSPAVSVPVRIVVVADDVSIQDDVEPRGLAGVAFVLKVAGAAIRRGMPFEEVIRIAEIASRSICTIGVALRPATLPGKRMISTRDGRPFGLNTELGLGIHNEPGAELLPYGPANSTDYVENIVATVFARLERAFIEKIPHNQLTSKSVAVLVNNLGGVSELAMRVLVKSVVQNVFRSHDCKGASDSRKIARAYICYGTLVSSLDMNGFSVSIMTLSDDLSESMLLAETNAPAWPRVVRVTLESYRQTREVFDANFSRTSQESKLHRHDQNLNVRCIHAVINKLLEHADELGELDSVTGDGDFGTTLRSGCHALQSQINTGNFDDIDGDKICRLIADTLGSSMGGTCGGLARAFFEACALSYAEVPDWKNAFSSGTDAITRIGRARVGDRTLVDALQPAAEALRNGKGIAAAAEMAKKGAESTAFMRAAKFGRSSHVSADHLLGVVDPGAAAVAHALTAYSICFGH